MRPGLFLRLLWSSSLVLAYPGMDGVLGAISKREKGKDGQFDSSELIGDLVSLGPVTPVGKLVYNILLGKEKPESDDEYQGALPGINSRACSQDTCCVWRHIAQDMQKLFSGPSGRCTKWARFAVRLGFHDAGTWSKGTAHLGGGADGSAVLAGEVYTRGENNGLQDIGRKMEQWYAKYKGFGVTMADLIQMGANVATVVCPLGPRVRSFVGRIDSSKPAPPDLLPSVNAMADDLIALFENKTIRAHGLAALVGAHTISQQQFVEPSRRLDPQDSTPGVWDVLFYAQTIGTARTPKRVFKFPSDVKLSVHPKISDEWKDFAGGGGQGHWNEVS